MKRFSFSVNNVCRRYSLWNHLTKAPLDGNHATNAAMEADPFPGKVNLGRGVYKTDEGKDWILPSVTMAEKVVCERLNHNYLKFSGLPEFTKLSREYIFKEDSKVVQEGRVATIQTISGTGGLRVGAEFLRRFRPNGLPNRVYVSNPTYVNHYPIFELNEFEIGTYRYFNYKTNGLDLEGMLEDIKDAPTGSIFLLHACAHNPTGVDPTLEQWKEISSVLKERNHIVFFDSAYQGFASGDPHRDAAAIRHFVEQDGHQVVLSQSYAKNMGLYGQRCGTLNVVTKSPEETSIVLSNLNLVVRPMYSNPPSFGAQIVSTVLGEPEIRAQWDKDIQTMSGRIQSMRQALRDHLEEFGSTRNWGHITNQIGMFAYSGLSKEEVTKLRDLHVYMNFDGRMSMSGVNTKNVKYLAECIHKVTK